MMRLPHARIADKLAVLAQPEEVRNGIRPLRFTVNLHARRNQRREASLERLLESLTIVVDSCRRNEGVFFRLNGLATGRPTEFNMAAKQRHERSNCCAPRCEIRSCPFSTSFDQATVSSLGESTTPPKSVNAASRPSIACSRSLTTIRNLSNRLVSDIPRFERRPSRSFVICLNWSVRPCANPNHVLSQIGANRLAGRRIDDQHASQLPIGN